LRYPNPARDIINVSVSNQLLNTAAQLAEMSGKIIHHFNITGTSFTIGMADLSRGI
jgi:Secretion system C-terminal sorting domain